MNRSPIISLSVAAAFIVSAAMLIGCAKPDQIKTYQTPTAGFILTEETYQSHGPISNDHSEIYAHLNRNSKSAKQLVLSGTYVALEKIVWTAPTEGTICMQPGGLTSQFHNDVTLYAGDDYKTIHFVLKEDC